MISYKHVPIFIIYNFNCVFIISVLFLSIYPYPPPPPSRTGFQDCSGLLAPERISATRRVGRLSMMMEDSLWSASSVGSWLAKSSSGQDTPDCHGSQVYYGLDLSSTCGGPIGQAPKLFLSYLKNPPKVLSYCHSKRQMYISVHGEYEGFTIVCFTESSLQIRQKVFYRHGENA